MSTARLAFGELAEGQAKKHLTINDNMYKLDVLVQTAVQDKDLTAPPGSPTEGHIYIVGSPATGAWVGKETQLAQYRNSAWSFTEPFAGFVCWVIDEADLYYWNGTSWNAGSPVATALDDLSDVDITTPTTGQVLSYDGTNWVNGSPGSTVAAIDDLSDVVITTPTTNDVLKYNGTNWVNGTISAGATDLDGLTDVIITTPLKDQVLKYNGTNWYNVKLDLDELGQVNITSGAKGDILVHNGTNWVDLAVGTNGQVLTASDAYTNGVYWDDPSGGAMALDDLTDVAASAPTIGYFLKWNGTSWVDSPASVAELEDVGDVVITTPSDGQVLKYSSGNWVNGSASVGTIALDDLSDVVITTPTSDQVLKYNGTNWINSATSGGGGASELDDLDDVTITSAANDQILQRVSGEWVNKKSSYIATLEGYPQLVDDADFMAPMAVIDTSTSYSYSSCASTTLDGEDSYTYYGYKHSDSYEISFGPRLGFPATLSEYISTYGAWTSTTKYNIYDPPNDGKWIVVIDGKAFFIKKFAYNDDDDKNYLLLSRVGYGNIPTGTWTTYILPEGLQAWKMKWVPHGVPTSTTSDGIKGQIAVQSGTTHYLYVCVADNTWRRVALSTW